MSSLENGYCDHVGRWVAGLITSTTYETPAPVHTIGGVVWYSEGLMEDAARNTGTDLTQYLDGIALMSCTDFGQIVWIKREGHDWEGPFIVVDCVQRQHMYSAIYYTGEVAEVGYKTAVRWGMIEETPDGRLVNSWILSNVQVYKGTSPPPGDAVPVDYVDWWSSMARFTNGESIYR